MIYEIFPIPGRLTVCDTVPYGIDDIRNIASPGNSDEGFCISSTVRFPILLYCIRTHTHEILGKQKPSFGVYAYYPTYLTQLHAISSWRHDRLHWSALDLRNLIMSRLTFPVCLFACLPALC
jgi:hypothetical protein